MYEANYFRKCKRAAIRFFDPVEGCCTSKKKIKELELKFIPIYQVKSHDQSSEIVQFLEDLRLVKSSRPMFYALEDGRYFGRLVSTRHGNVWGNRFEVLCDQLVDKSTHLESIEETNFVLNFRPDFVLYVIDYRFPLVLVKDKNFYFIKYFNETKLKVIDPIDWINDFQRKTGSPWTSLSLR